jgi:periplasmic divalent cation tolerance protein
MGGDRPRTTRQAALIGALTAAVAPGYTAPVTDALLVFTTLPSPEKAAELARILVEEGLVACGNVLPAVRSIYKWEGKVEDENEVMLLLKTRAEHLERLKLRILEVHPYEVPEVLAIPVESGYRAYLEWIAAETK